LPNQNAASGQRGQIALHFVEALLNDAVASAAQSAVGMPKTEPVVALPKPAVAPRTLANLFRFLRKQPLSLH
jgi:hypothetical protein